MNNRTLLLTGILALATCPWAAAGTKIDETIDADPAGVVLIENVRGRIEVRGWEKEAVHVKGELDDLSNGLRFEREGKVTTVRVLLPEHNINSGDGSTLDIRVPRGSRVEFKGVSSSLDVAGIAGGVQLRTISGDLKIRDIEGSSMIKTVSGDLDIEGTGGNAQIKSVSGDLDLSLTSRELTLSSVSGDVRLGLATFDQLSVSSVSGDLEIEGTLAAGGRADIKTVSGNCTLALRGTPAARISVRTGPGGSIRNGLDDTVPEQVFPAQERLETTLGDGSGSISISTISGEIELERK